MKTLKNRLLISLAVILLLAVQVYAELGTPIEALRETISEYTVSYAADTTIIEYSARKGHVLGKSVNSLPAKWYFVNGIAVKIEMEMTNREIRLQRKHLRRNWTDMGGYFQDGNILARIDGNLIIVWYEN